MFFPPSSFIDPTGDINFTINNNSYLVEKILHAHLRNNKMRARTKISLQNYLSANVIVIFSNVRVFIECNSRRVVRYVVALSLINFVRECIFVANIRPLIGHNLGRRAKKMNTSCCVISPAKNLPLGRSFSELVAPSLSDRLGLRMAPQTQ